MNFARKQLEKYGWTDGKGLGKHEDGISQALKPKLKRSVTGIGYDAAADFTEHWWSALYDKAAGNVEVEEKNGETKRMKRKDDKEFEITNSTWRLKRKTDDKNAEEYSEFFVRTAVLDSGGSKITKVKDSDSDTESESGNNVMKMTDEELFAACQGRTAHKGARHGLRALGKLARIEQQEQLLLQQSKYNSFLHKKKNIPEDSQVVEDTSLNDEIVEKKKKGKKKKRCNRNENELNNVNISSMELNNLVNIVTNDNQMKAKKSKHKEVDCEKDDDLDKELIVKKRTIDSALDSETLKKPQVEAETTSSKKKKKNK